MEQAAYFKYWGKAGLNHESSSQFHLLAYHCLDVAAVGNALLSNEKKLICDLADFLGLPRNQLRVILVFALVLHDLGKFASAFQKLYDTDSEQLISSACRKEYNGREFRHDRLGVYFWEHIKPALFQRITNSEREISSDPALDSLFVLMGCVFGHHGQPVKTDGGVRQMKSFVEPCNVEAASDFVLDIFELLQPNFPLEKLQSEAWRKRLELVSWQLAGIAVLADWIGSDIGHFRYVSAPMPLLDYWLQAKECADIALAATDLACPPAIQPYLSIEEYYGFEATPLQHWAETVDIDESPQLFILEDIAGSGKTEAALALTHRLMLAGAAEGFYFGLPTMATSNAMFGRVASHYQKMLAGDGGRPSIVLAHGARDMNDLFREAVLASDNPDSHYDSTDSTATAQCNRWLADSRKKALLAPVGVGTIDQALLAVLPRRHQSLRLLGLNRKVLIFDEVHAADDFMFELLESLLSLHLHQGGSAILLTATLSQKQRHRLVEIWHRAGNVAPLRPKKVDFPLATKASLNAEMPLVEQTLVSRSDVSREVKVSFLQTAESCIEKVLESVASGQCVVWVRNSVDDAIWAYQELQQRLGDSDNCLLFHSRFVLNDRKRIEERVLAIFGKNGDNSTRRGKVLIATQVFQESLDADADVMICDLCPIDGLIQRAGRLHRHTRDAQGVYRRGILDARHQPHLWVHSPAWQDDPPTDWLSANFRNTQYVYRSPGRLWLGMRVLRELGAIRMPDQARTLIEAVYGDDAYKHIPAALLDQENTLIGEERSEAAKAKSQLLKWDEYGYCEKSAAHNAWYEDNADISTRYSDIETVDVLLLKEVSDGELEPWSGSGQFAVPLSTVKLSKTKFADKLEPIPARLEQAVTSLKHQFRQAKYVQCWLPREDFIFSYCDTLGFYKKSPL
ncbi:MAG: CRISPR-associated helicase/endonuclease Cas3 [Kangiellaceae bacterium]|nr:CRISPR-associated helicase/endonuclease Cas3 [Kangiellaceae bacterium]